MSDQLHFTTGIKRKASRRNLKFKKTIQQLAEINRKSKERHEEREHKRMLAFIET